ncbi:MAG: OsmC family protein [Acidobacteriota bacterium]
MAVEISGEYAGNLKVNMTHGPSGTSLTTAAPVDNQGDGSSFSPTDLVAAALGSCMVTLIAIAAERDGIDCAGLGFSLEKHMSLAPRRVESVPIRIRMPAGLNGKQRTFLERAAMTCPVQRTLRPDFERPVIFDYGS